MNGVGSSFRAAEGESFAPKSAETPLIIKGGNIMDDMLAIPLVEIASMLKKVEEEDKFAVEDCVMVVPKDDKDTQFYVIKKSDL